MPIFDLPSLTPEAKPEFDDAKSCVKWLESLPLANVAASHARLLAQVREFDRLGATASERLRVLEVLSQAVAFLQAEHSRKYAGKPVPLNAHERDTFREVVALWQAVGHGYQRCAESIVAGASDIAGQSALVFQRALWCVAMIMAEHYRSVQEFGDEVWRLLHRIYAIAEDRGVHEVEVGDCGPESHLTTCQRTYACTLLLHIANESSEQSARRLAIVSTWLDRWAPRVGIAGEQQVSQHGVPALSVDLAGSGPPVRASPAVATVRHLQLDEIARTLRSRIALLRKGETPEAAGLGDQISAPAAEQLLLALHRRWCEDFKPRVSTRRPSVTPALVCAGLPAMHYFISGKPFHQPGEAKEFTQVQREEIATFGRISTRRDDEPAPDFALESWIIRDESIGGLRIERPAESGRGRFVQRQLVAVRPADGNSFMLGVLRWLSVSTALELRAGLQVLPGAPQAVAVRTTGINVVSNQFVPALLLPAVAVLQSPVTLILPAGWYRPKRIIEVYGSKSETVLLTGLIERGADFDRVSFGAP